MRNYTGYAAISKRLSFLHFIHESFGHTVPWIELRYREAFRLGWYPDNQPYFSPVTTLIMLWQDMK